MRKLLSGGKGFAGSDFGKLVGFIGQTFGVRPSEILHISDDVEAILLDAAIAAEILKEMSPPTSVKERILRKRRQLGLL